MSFLLRRILPTLLLPLISSLSSCQTSSSEPSETIPTITTTTNFGDELQQNPYVTKIDNHDDWKNATSIDGPAFVLFSRPTCPYCRTLASNLDQITQNTALTAPILYFNTDNKSPFMDEQIQKYGIESVPAFIKVSFENEGNRVHVTRQNPNHYASSWSIDELQAFLTSEY